MSNLSMTRVEREASLADTHVALLAISDADRAPLLVPVWYWYRPGGDVHVVTGGKSRKAQLIRKAGRASFCVQTETPPYKYVTVEGPIAVAGEPEYERDVRAVAIRYLGEQMGEMYLAMSAAEHAGSVLVRLRPERWLSVDFTKLAP